MGGLRTGIKPVHIASASKMVTDFSGMPIQPHKVCLHHLTSMLCAPDMLVGAYLLVSTQADIVIQLQSAITRTYITVCSILAMAWPDLNPECS